MSSYKSIITIQFLLLHNNQSNQIVKPIILLYY